MASRNYYTSLAPFRELFGTGAPILTFHHVGPRPAGVRIKGLFVGTKLFSKQIRELANSRFKGGEYDNVLSTISEPSNPSNASKSRPVFITFDDGFVDVYDNTLPIIRQNRFSSIQFLVADLLGKTNEWQQRAGDVSQPLMDVSQIREWLSAGQQIGSHTCTHPRLTRIPIEQAREEISSSKKKLEDTFGRVMNHFCYPYGDWNQAVRDLVEEAGYKTACTTQSGINTQETDPFALKRFTARYRSRTWRSLVSWLRSGD